MRFIKRNINKLICFTVLASICCNSVNAVSIDVCDYRFVSNAGIIEHIKSCVDFSGPSFESLWSLDRAKESREHLAIDTEHMAYTVQLSPELKVDEIYISAPIIDRTSNAKVVGTVFLSAGYDKNEAILSNVIKDFCLVEKLPQNLNLAGKEDIQYFLNAPDAPTELPVEFQKIESLSELGEKKDELEATEVVVNDKDGKTLDTCMFNINKITLVNIIKTGEQISK